MENVTVLTPKEKGADAYLVNPFLNTINYSEFYSTTGLMKVLVGVTGQGKTYNTAKVFIPTLAKEHGIELIIVSVPQTEILDPIDFKISAGLSGMVHTTSSDEALDLLEEGAKVLLTTTHQSFTVTQKGKDFVNTLLQSSYKYAVFIDEAHTWMASHSTTYKDVLGHYCPDYEATLFKALNVLSNKSPYIFGLTATPNPEQVGKIQTVGGMKFGVINEIPPKHLLIGKTAWFGGCVSYSPDFTDKFVINLKFEKQILKLFNDTMFCGIKKTMLVSVNNDNSTLGYQLDYVMQIVKATLYSNALVGEDEKVIAVLTGDASVTGAYSVDGSFDKLNETQIKKKLNDNNDPLQIVLVKQKGKMGMNIHTLKSLVSFKPQDKKDTFGDPLSEFAIQLLGRLVRLNTGMNVKDFTEQYGYDLTKYIQTLNDEEVEKLIVANTFDIMVPDTVMWNDALTKFAKTYTSSVQQAKTWVHYIKKDKHEG